VKEKYLKFEKTIGGLKFGVSIIGIFCLMMIVGTFIESYYGTEFANRVLYKTFPFMFLQFCMFLSIYMATVIRLPTKKRLYGFYVIHTGLITIFVGSFVTWYSGIDGMIDLQPNQPSRTIVLDQDIIKIIYPDTGKFVTKKLPFNAFSTNLDIKYDGIHFKDYFPYSDEIITWKKDNGEISPLASYQSTRYQLFNENMSQDLIVSLHPKSFEFKSTLRMGLLDINYLPIELASCFKRNNPSDLIIWNQVTKKCSTPEEDKIDIQATKSGNRFLVLKEGKAYYPFFPEFSPLPINDKMKVMENSPIKVFSKRLYEKSPALFLFGKTLSFYTKNLETPAWEFKSLDKGIINLPWMGFKLRLIRHESSSYPAYIPKSVLPIQKDGQLITGNVRALKVTFDNQDYWLTDSKPVGLHKHGKRIFIQLTKETLTLPFEFILTKFKMDKNPGTDKPASFESFVRLFTKDGSTNHHVFMNNPLKYNGFTFYQASYNQDPKTGEYSSSLSANIDQGRWLKYLGSLLLVFGSIWHYIINRKKKKKVLA
jgi:hypothetical protein